MNLLNLTSYNRFANIGMYIVDAYYVFEKVS